MIKCQGNRPDYKDSEQLSGISDQIDDLDLDFDPELELYIDLDISHS